MGLSVNYFTNFGAECHFSNLGFIESLVSPKEGNVSVIYPKKKKVHLVMNL